METLLEMVKILTDRAKLAIVTFSENSFVSVYLSEMEAILDL